MSRIQLAYNWLIGGRTENGLDPCQVSLDEIVSSHHGQSSPEFSLFAVAPSSADLFARWEQYSGLGFYA